MEQENLAMRIEEMLNKMTREELVHLNREIIRRVKIMDDLNRLKANSAFYPGDKVSWQDKEGYVLVGRVLRVNTKTISVEEDGDPEGIWRIPATLLKKL
ncbi:MAG: hypothetical protein ABFS38_22270 [Bacteroidota bacterium]